MVYVRWGEIMVYFKGVSKLSSVKAEEEGVRLHPGVHDLTEENVLYPV